MDKKREHWFELFNVEKFETHYKDIDYEQLIGFDPGVREIYTSLVIVEEYFRQGIKNIDTKAK
jgi:transposase